MNYSRKYILTASIGLATLAGFTACHRSTQAAQIQDASSTGDPSDQNMAPVDSSGQPITGAPDGQNESQQQATPYANGGAPIVRQAPSSQAPGATAPTPDQYAQQQGYATDDQGDQNYDQDQVDAGQAALEAPEAPPELPVYDQPPAPDPDYLWTPGYWDYAPAGGYYWVPGAWVAAPYTGALWTPGYWFFFGNHYRFHRGYWGPYIGFYGGINYGFGYFGSGYHGGYWNGSHFYYNRSVNNVGHVSYVYNRPVTIVNRGNRIAFNGGSHGVQARPSQAEAAALRSPRVPAMTAQRDNARAASQNHAQFYNQNKGRPAMVASPRPFTADKGIQRPAPNQQRPAPSQGQFNRPNQPANQPANQGRPAESVRPGQPNNVRPNPGQYPGQSQGRPNQGQEQNRPNQQPAIRPTPRQANPEVRPTPQQPQNQSRPNSFEQKPRVQPEVRPTPQRSNPEVRPMPQQQQRPAPEARPAPQARPEQRPAAPSRPAPEARQAPHQAPHPAPAPKPEDHPRG